MKKMYLLLLCVTLSFISCTSVKDIEHQTKGVDIQSMVQQKEKFRAIYGPSHIGVGMGETTTYEEAKAQAVADLASQLQVKVSSTTSIEEYDDSLSASSAFSQKITLEIIQDITDITYEVYEMGDTTTVFAILRESDWEAQKQRWIESLVEKVSQSVLSINDSKLYLSQMQILEESLHVLEESPWGGYAKGVLFDREGLLLNLISQRIHQLKQGISLTFIPMEQIRGSSDVPVTINATHAENLSLEGLPIVFSATDPLGTVVFQQNLIIKHQNTEVTIPKAKLAHLSQVQLNIWHEDSLKDYLQLGIAIPLAVFRLEGYAPLLENGNPYLADLSSLLGVEVTEDPSISQQVVRILIDAIEYPENQFSSIRIIDGKLIISVWSQGELIDRFETETVKGSGVSIEQARQDLQRKLMKQVGLLKQP